MKHPKLTHMSKSTGRAHEFLIAVAIGSNRNKFDENGFPSDQ